MSTVVEGTLERPDFIVKLSEKITSFDVVNNNKNIQYYNVPAAFDIEASSFYDGPECIENKRAIMYIWQLGIGSYITYGRTWKEFLETIELVKIILGLNENLRLVIYVHNLEYDFQFFRKYFKWDEVFLMESRKPIYAHSAGLEFRCSYRLSRKSLSLIGRDLNKYKAEKKTGQLDYSLLRTPLTPLTDLELEYCLCDIEVLLCYIQEKIEVDGDITKIPLTNTGYVRQFCRKRAFRSWRKYRKLMDQLTVEANEYDMLKNTFQGGFTHANAHYVEKTLYQVGSHDIKSSYPAAMVLEMFPMSKGIQLDYTPSPDEFEELLLTHSVMFVLHIIGVIPKIHQEHGISVSKCIYKLGETVDNGRIVSADYIAVACTEQDYFTYKEIYTWEEELPTNIWVYERNYLPRNFVDSVLELYEKKTELQGIDGQEVNYQIHKEMANSTYGMSVTDPVREEVSYINHLYVPKGKDVEKSISKYNNNVKRFLFYPWGVWITAYARANLWSGILSVGEDYCYSDTDGLKTLNTERHEDYFKRYNHETVLKIQKSAAHFGFDEKRYMPRGEIIGRWTDEGVYTRFKTLGAKRYLYEKDGELVLTVAGANKKQAGQYLKETGEPFEAFQDELVIPASHSGRVIHTYIDHETEGDIVDYTGIPYHYHELSSIFMENSAYKMSISEQFSDYLKGIRDVYE